ncbi:MAG: 2-C-methyl-D-erythritol 4-phosphate cytidylyltransferase [Bacteroidales bacterium]|nr:2-C-methyl-D-erythritol 4-phosphate cytidylyltransferase [Bacteroidales bacterium]MDD4602736.1 2-C-methyl-D-erythritol 4-phosphate cytidylyltransferase [Bacteroidales bacterium]
MKKSAIIVAGGIGNRMKAEVPKQFLLLAGKPVLMYCIEAFNQAFTDLIPVIVLPKDQFKTWKDLCSRFSFTFPHRLVAGGETRFHSVKNGLEKISSEGMVAIHDGVRPLISPTLIRKVFEAAEINGNCIPMIPIHDSMRRITKLKNRPVNRMNYCIIQTPQVFNAAIIKKAYLNPYSDAFTDDASVLETLGETIHLIPGESLNLKITHPDDLTLAEAFLSLPFQR